MEDLEEQRVCMKFCFKLGKTFKESFQMVQQAYGEDCLSRTQCHVWYQRFKRGRTSTEDDPKSRSQSRSNVEVMLIVFFDWKGVVHHEFVPRGHTVNKKFYLEVLKCLTEAVRRKRPEAWTSKT
ncbi:GVQW3-like 1 [Homarus americanus]|uniref:GVQW3-like 1 n=1 Tax=Homarus americanus TaxID=6706 RepID=A0A8J5N229_HOMAM|nr:GVQW3-like 1 [Homarus americanus]